MESRWWRWRHACSGAREEHQHPSSRPREHASSRAREHASCRAREHMLHIHACIYSRSTDACVCLVFWLACTKFGACNRFTSCTSFASSISFASLHARGMDDLALELLELRQVVNVLRSLFCFQHANLVERNHRVRRYTYRTTHTSHISHTSISHTSHISHHTCITTYTYLA